MDGNYEPYLDGDPRPLDNRMPPNSPPPQEEGEPYEPGGAEDAVAQVATAAHAAFEVNEVWTMPRHPTYEHHLNMMNGLSECRAENRKLCRIINNNVRAFGGSIQGSLVRQRASNRGVSVAGMNSDQEEEDLVPLEEGTPATLSNNPRSLLMLWAEYKHGINGRKPAERFTREERNVKANKHKYYRRNHVWETIARLVRGGLTAEVAIERIYSVYGYDSSTTKIMTGMVRDKKRHPGGLHPNQR